MSTIPTSVTEAQFDKYISPYLSKAKRGYVSKIPMYKIFNYILYWLYTGCQWRQIPIHRDSYEPEKLEISYDAVYYHYRKWSRDGSFDKLWQSSIAQIKAQLDLSHINLDGSHTIAKKGGESVKYQGRKRAKTSNILSITDANGYVIATTAIVSGNHNDAYNLKHNLRNCFKHIRGLGISLKASYFNADPAFDSKMTRKVCFNHGLIPNIPENSRNRQFSKVGRKRLFNQTIYKLRFTAERTFAWVDKFKRLLIRFERVAAFFLAAHFIAFSLINLRHLLAYDCFT